MGCEHQSVEQWCGDESVGQLEKSSESLGSKKGHEKTSDGTMSLNTALPQGRQLSLSSSVETRSDASPCSDGLVPPPDVPPVLLSSRPLLSSGMRIAMRGALMGGTWPSRDGRLLLRLPVLLAAVSAALAVPLRLHTRWEEGGPPVMQGQRGDAPKGTWLSSRTNLPTGGRA